MCHCRYVNERDGCNYFQFLLWLKYGCHLLHAVCVAVSRCSCCKIYRSMPTKNYPSKARSSKHMRQLDYKWVHKICVHACWQAHIPHLGARREYIPVFSRKDCFKKVCPLTTPACAICKKHVMHAGINDIIKFIYQFSASVKSSSRDAQTNTHTYAPMHQDLLWSLGHDRKTVHCEGELSSICSRW